MPSAVSLKAGQIALYRRCSLARAEAEARSPANIGNGASRRRSSAARSILIRASHKLTFADHLGQIGPRFDGLNDLIRFGTRRRSIIPQPVRNT